MNKFRKIFICVIALIGILLCLELSVIYFEANFNPYALPSFCNINDVIDCDGVAKTDFSQFCGIPLALWGLFFYVFVLLMIFARQLSKFKYLKFFEVFKNPGSYLFLLGLISFCISITLAGISVFEIQKICILCLITYVLNLIIAVIAKDTKQPFTYEFKQSFSDLKEALSVKKYLISFIIVVIAACGLLTFMSIGKVLTPQLKKEDTVKLPQELILSGNTIGSQNAKVIVKEFMDYNCGACYMMNLMLKRAVTELDGVAVTQYNLPLDSECNDKVQKGHQGSCLAARYAIAAKNQGTYWQVNDILFDKTPKSEKETIKFLKKIRGLNIKQLQADANSDEVKKELQLEIKLSREMDINATPSITVNGRKIIGSMPYYDLKAKLIEAGATEKIPQ